jgi:DNA-binding Xre family transcriptional regulator
MAREKMSISELSRLLNISWPTAQKIAKGHAGSIRLDHLQVLCEHFGVSVEGILEYRHNNRKLGQ